MKLYSALYNDFYPFQHMSLFDDYSVVMDPADMDSDDAALVVWGGEDISPALYNKPVSNYTGAGPRPSKRDAYEWALMQAAQERGIPIIGICRGAQMLCALAGGFLIQDVTGHAIGRQHSVKTKEGRSFAVNSLHHQMLYPWDVEHELIAWSPVPLSDHYMDVNQPIAVPCEPEFVYFPKQKGIAIQWHPEYMEIELEAQAYVAEKLKELL